MSAVMPAAPRARVRPAAAAEPVLKLYIDSTSLPLVHQMADFVAGAERPELTQWVTWLRLPLSAEQLAGSNARYLPQLAAVSASFVAAVCQLVKQRGLRRIEIHSNLYHAWRGIVPLLRELIPLLPDARDAITLDLYDDGTVGLLQRETLKAEPDPAALIATAAQGLRRAVFDRQPLAWGLPQSYAWHHLFETRYHLLRRDLLLRDAPGRALHGYFEPFAVDMQFDGLPQLNDAQCQRYLQLFGLDAALAERLAPVAGRSDALLFTGTGTWDKAQNLALAENQLRAIAALHEGGCLPADWPIAYKGHPANTEHDARLMAALGEQVIALPPQVPLEVLLMAGLLPRRVAGVISTTYCTLPAGSIEYLLCRREAVQGGAGSALVNLMLDTGMVDAERLLPLLD
ncbi:MAG TPA: hypothetical protein VLA16_06375 [Ideonella sp.]|nr:hypothetical protein [Ideonella sp.]